MKNVKKILSLVLVLVISLGCLGMTVSATEIDPDDVYSGDYPSVKGVEFIVNSKTYPGELIINTVTDTASYVAYIPETTANLSSASVRVTAGKTSTAVTVNNSEQSISANGSYTWTGVNLNTLSGITIGATTHAFSLETGFDLELDAVSIGGQPATISNSLSGSVPRYSAKANVSGSLTSLAVSITPHNSTGISYKMDGVSFTSGSPVDFTASSHVLTVTDTVSGVSVSRDYRLYATGNTITVYVGVRTWTAVDWNNNSTDRYDYSVWGLENGNLPNSDLDELAASIDTVGRISGTAQAPNMTSGRPIFNTTDYVAVELDSASGYSAFNALAKYATVISASYTFTGTPSDDLDEMTYLSGINGLNEMGCNDASGWMYLVRSANNDVTTDMPNTSAADYVLSDGQYLDWIYTCAWGMDFGYSMFDLD